jgi:hypothetical protein
MRKRKTMHERNEQPCVAVWRSGGVADNVSSEQINESQPECR